MTSEGTVSGISGGFRFWSSQRAARLDGGGDPLSLELGARIELLEQLRVLTHLVTCSECVIPSRLELQSGPGRHAWLPSLRQWLGRNGWARLLLLRASPPVLGSRRGVDGSHRTQTARAAHVVDNVLPPFHGEKRVVFLAILAVARLVIWTTRKKGLYDDADFSYRDLVLYFRHQPRVKIRCDRKRLDRMTFSKRWVNAASLVVRKGQCWSHPSLLCRPMASTVRVLRDPTIGK